MAIGTAAAIGLGLAGAGSIIGAGSSSKAASKAADTSMAVANSNNALARDIYGQNKGVLSPFVQGGAAAGQRINALLGLPGVISGYGGGTFDMNGRPVTTGMDGEPAAAARSAFDAFRGSTGYDFRFGEGMRALNTGFAAQGLLNSGAARKEAVRYGQNIGSQEFGNYLGYLGNQQGVGLSAGSALAGVGQNYANSVMSNNTNAGNNAANALLIKGQNNPFAAGLGTLGGFASSYGR
jgi:hypothetical protein